MAEQKSRLVIEISTEHAKRNAEALSRELNSIEKNGKFATSSMDSMSVAARTLAANMAGIVTVGTAINKMDAYTNVQNRLKLVTTSQTELNRAMNDTFLIAQKSYASWDSVVQVYQRFSDNAKRLKIDMTQTAALTETVSKAVAISGASTQAAEAALTQFGQALAQGQLRGEELNSVMEQTPALAKAIAEGMGLSIGQLRSVAAEGKITGDVLVKALTKSKDKVDELFSKTDITIGQSLTQLSNEVTKFSGEAGKSSGAASALASSIQLVSNNFNTFANLGIAVTIGYITAALVRKTTVLAASTMAWSAETKAVIANNAAKSSSLLIGRSLLGVLGGPVGLGLTVTGVAASYLLMKDNGEEVNKMLQLQGKYADKAATELSKLSGNDKKNAISDLTSIFEEQNKELAKSKEAVDAVLFAIRAASVENEKARKVTEDARNGVISYNDAIKLLNKMKIPTDLYEKLKQQAGQYDENSLKAGKAQAQLFSLGERVKLTGNDFQNAANGVGIFGNSLNQAKKDIKEIDEKLAELRAKSLSETKKNKIYIDTLNASKSTWGTDWADFQEKFKQENKLPQDKILDSAQLKVAHELFLSDQKRKALEEQVSNEKKNQTKEAERQLKILQLSSQVQANAAKYNFSGLESKYGLPNGMLSVLHAIETGNTGKTAQVNKKTGATGGFQFLEGTAKQYGVKDRTNLAQSAEGAAKYMAYLLKLFKGDLEKAVRAYHAGEGNVQKGTNIGKYNNDYISKYMGYTAGQSGITGNIKDVESFLNEQYQLQLRTQQEIDQLKAQYSSADVVRNKKRIEEIANAEKLGQQALIPQINARYDAQDQIAKLQLDAELNAYKWTEEQKLQNTRDINIQRLTAEGQYSEAEMALRRKAYDNQLTYELNAKRQARELEFMELRQSLMLQQSEASKVIADYQLRQQFGSGFEYQKIKLGLDYVGSDQQNTASYESDIEAYRRKLEEQRITDEQFYQLSIEREQAYLDSKLANHLKYDQSVKDLTQRQQEAQLQSWQTVLTQGQNTFAQLTQSVRDANGEQSSTYKTMFALQKTFTIASATMSAYQAYIEAFKDPSAMTLAQKFAGGAAVMAAVMPAIAAISSIGYSEGGYTGHGGKYDPAGIVHKGEVVFSQEDIRRLGGVGVVESMRKGQKGYSDGGVVGLPKVVGFKNQSSQPNVTINNYGNDQVEASTDIDGNLLVTIGKVIDQKVDHKIDQRFIKARRQGGELYGLK